MIRHGQRRSLDHPVHSIDRIEITRGNSGAVLYGVNAIGGVINIVLQNGADGPPVDDEGRGRVGSFNTRLANISAATNYGPWSTSFYGNAIKSDGYRDNNALDQQQRRRQSQLHHARPQGVPDRHRRRPEAGLPRRPHRRSLAGHQRTGHKPPWHQHPVRLWQPAGRQATAGFTKTLIDGVDLIVDGGVRDKKSQAGFFGMLPTIPFNYVDSHLQTWSITPRLSIKNSIVRNAFCRS